MQTTMISEALNKYWFKFQIQILWCSFTRNDSFLPTLYQSPPWKYSPSASRHLKILVVSLILTRSYANQDDSIIKGWKHRSKRPYTLILSQKLTNKNTGSAWHFLQSPDYHRNSSELTPAIQPHIFQWTPYGIVSLQNKC